MQGDSGSAVPQRPHRDIWTLPGILSLKIVRRLYDPPRRFPVAGRQIEIAEGIEIVIETDGDIPIRALAPVLNVGPVQIVESREAGAHVYRFFVVDQALRDGDPIRLGWMGLPPPAAAEARFTYHPPGGPAEPTPQLRPRPRRGFLWAILRWLRRLFFGTAERR